jgi:putative transposase
LLTNYVYKLRPNPTQDAKMSNWVDMLRSHYNWCLNDRITQYNQQFVQGNYSDIIRQIEACPLTCFVSKNGATGNPWKESTLRLRSGTASDSSGQVKNPRRSAGDIQITALPELKTARSWYKSIDSTVLQQNVKRLDIVVKIIGCDLGITKLVHLSDGHQIRNPKFSTNKKAKRTLKIRQRRVNRKVKGSKNRKKAAKRVGLFHRKISDRRQAYQWKTAQKIVDRNVDAIALENLNISGMMRRCRVKIDEKTGRFLKNGQSRKKGLNRSISDAGWAELTLKIEYLAAKQGKIVIKVNPKYSSTECRNCGNIDKSNREGEKFICVECGYHEHADIGAAKTIRDRAFEMVRRDSAKPGIMYLNAQNISLRSKSFRSEFGNPSNRDIKTEMS